jgi:hypothetical protein
METPPDPLTQTKNIPIRLTPKELSKILPISRPIFQGPYVTIGIEGGAALSPEAKGGTKMSRLKGENPS